MQRILLNIAKSTVYLVVTSAIRSNLEPRHLSTRDVILIQIANLFARGDVSVRENVGGNMIPVKISPP